MSCLSPALPAGFPLNARERGYFSRPFLLPAKHQSKKRLAATDSRAAEPLALAVAAQLHSTIDHEKGGRMEGNQHCARRAVLRGGARSKIRPSLVPLPLRLFAREDRVRGRAGPPRQQSGWVWIEGRKEGRKVAFLIKNS